MHPTMPAAAVAKFKHRLRTSVGSNIGRVRVLPPLEEPLLRALHRSAVAVLDSYPVGMHTQLLDAMMDQVPVISAFSLQECTNSHAFSFARFFNINSAYMGNSHRDAVRRARPQTTTGSRSSSNSNNRFNTGDEIAKDATTEKLTAAAVNAPGGKSARERRLQEQKEAAALRMREELAGLEEYAASEVETDNYDWLYPNSPEELGVLAVRISREESVRNAFRVTHKSTIDRLVQKGKASKTSQGAQLLAFFRRLHKGYNVPEEDTNTRG
jgi:hypothetical protein